MKNILKSYTTEKMFRIQFCNFAKYALYRYQYVDRHLHRWGQIGYLSLVASKSLFIGAVSYFYNQRLWSMSQEKFAEEGAAMQTYEIKGVPKNCNACA